ncbi:hypothetical protein SISNIDRAFT_484960 [Sistotremastrum niveocremeum HHB9708]|uniref:Uncharacterized protein n=1 Tax=Sistotremastrum niveocremeum HHB9708 TaxID=1314777 RepID=A0A164VBJ7_9AGAM|nr:hypothetical protein SISNIDRAFT_484960 [Sistotremastrum niveocremeum HHB9708]
MRLSSVFLVFAVVASAGLGKRIYKDGSSRHSSPSLSDDKAAAGYQQIKPLSNAALLAAGLPPRSPKFLQDGIFKRQASRVELAPRQAVSMTPLALPFMAHMVVKDMNGLALGFISQTLNGYYQFKFITDITKAAIFTVSSTTGFVDIAVAGQALPFIGIGLGPGSKGNRFGPGNAAWGYITIVPSSWYEVAGDFVGSGESTIWQIDPWTLSVTAQWRNFAVSVPLIIFTEGIAGLSLTADLQAYSAAFPTQTVQPVALSLLPI